YSISLPKQGQTEGLYFSFHMSPDARIIAVSGILEGAAGIFVRERDAWNFRRLPGTNTGDFFWSPDSRYIGFFDNRKLKRVKVSGGPAEEICDFPGFNNATGTWSRDDVIVFSVSDGPLLRVSATGGEVRPVTAPNAGTNHLYPSFLPDSQHFLYTQRGAAP